MRKEYKSLIVGLKVSNRRHDKLEELYVKNTESEILPYGLRHKVVELTEDINEAMVIDIETYINSFSTTELYTDIRALDDDRRLYTYSILDGETKERLNSSEELELDVSCKLEKARTRHEDSIKEQRAKLRYDSFPIEHYTHNRDHHVKVKGIIPDVIVKEPAVMYINVSKIVNYVETSKDTCTVYMESGLEINVVESLESFTSKISETYSK